MTTPINRDELFQNMLILALGGDAYNAQRLLRQLHIDGTLVWPDPGITDADMAASPLSTDGKRISPARLATEITNRLVTGGAQVKPDWNVPVGDNAEILNKPSPVLPEVTTLRQGDPSGTDHVVVRRLGDPIGPNLAPGYVWELVPWARVIAQQGTGATYTQGTPRNLLNSQNRANPPIPGTGVNATGSGQVWSSDDLADSLVDARIRVVNNDVSSLQLNAGNLRRWLEQSVEKGLDAVRVLVVIMEGHTPPGIDGPIMLKAGVGAGAPLLNTIGGWTDSDNLYGFVLPDSTAGPSADAIPMKDANGVWRRAQDLTLPAGLVIEFAWDQKVIPDDPADVRNSVSHQSYEFTGEIIGSIQYGGSGGMSGGNLFGSDAIDPTVLDEYYDVFDNLDDEVWQVVTNASSFQVNGVNKPNPTTAELCYIRAEVSVDLNDHLPASWNMVQRYDISAAGVATPNGSGLYRRAHQVTGLRGGLLIAWDRVGTSATNSVRRGTVRGTIGPDWPTTEFTGTVDPALDRIALRDHSDSRIWKLAPASAFVGPRGLRGPQGNPGADSTVPGPQGNPGADSTVPGPQGPPGAPSQVPGPQGNPGLSGWYPSAFEIVTPSGNTDARYLRVTQWTRAPSASPQPITITGDIRGPAGPAGGGGPRGLTGPQGPPGPSVTGPAGTPGTDGDLVSVTVQSGSGINVNFNRTNRTVVIDSTELNRRVTALEP